MRMHCIPFCEQQKKTIIPSSFETTHGIVQGSANAAREPQCGSPTRLGWLTSKYAIFANTFQSLNSLPNLIMFIKIYTIISKKFGSLRSPSLFASISVMQFFYQMDARLRLYLPARTYFHKLKWF